MNQKIVIGFVLSILASIAGSYIYLEFATPDGFETSWKMMVEGHLQSIVLSLGAIPNLLLFFVFIKRKEDYKARGVLMGVIFIALVILYFKLSFF
jgi:uncharacterized membrane protein YozB (DUF420 family)